MFIDSNFESINFVPRIIRMSEFHKLATLYQMFIQWKRSNIKWISAQSSDIIELRFAFHKIKNPIFVHQSNEGLHKYYLHAFNSPNYLESHQRFINVSKLLELFLFSKTLSFFIHFFITFQFMQIRKLYETLSEINGKLSTYFKWDIKSFFNFPQFVFAHNTI